MLLTEYDEDVIVAGYREEAYEEGKLETMLDLVNSGDLALEVGVRRSGLTEAEFNRALEEYRKTHHND